MSEHEVATTCRGNSRSTRSVVCTGMDACRDCGSTAQVIRTRQGRERLECTDCGLSTPTSSPLLMEDSDG